MKNNILNTFLPKKTFIQTNMKTASSIYNNNNNNNNKQQLYPKNIDVRSSYHNISQQRSDAIYNEYQRKVNTKTKKKTTKNNNNKNKRRKQRTKQMKILQPLTLQHSPSREIKHFVTGSPMTPHKSISMPTINSKSTKKILRKRQKKKKNNNNNNNKDHHSTFYKKKNRKSRNNDINKHHIILLIDTNVNFTANQNEQIKRTMESSLPLPYIYQQRSIFGNTKVLSSSFPAKTSFENIGNRKSRTFREMEKYNNSNNNNNNNNINHKNNRHRIQTTNNHRVKVRLRYKPETVPGVYFGGTNDAAAFCELLCPSDVLVDINKNVDLTQTIQIFISETLKRILLIPIDRYYLKFDISDINNKKMLIMNYKNAPNYKNPYDRMHLLKKFQPRTCNKTGGKGYFEDAIAFPGDFNYMLPPSSPPHVHYNKIPASTTTTTITTNFSNINGMKLPSFSNNNNNSNDNNETKNEINSKFNEEDVNYYNGNINNLLYVKDYNNHYYGAENNYYNVIDIKSQTFNNKTETFSIGKNALPQGDGLLARRMVHSRARSSGYL